MKKTLSVWNPLFTDDLFSGLTKSLDAFAPMARMSATPSIDVKETDKAYIMEVELPGFDEKDVEINLHDKVLTISSVSNKETEEKKEEDGVEYLIKERSGREFARRFTLPNDVDCDGVTAEFEKGVLNINIPRKPDTQPRKIEVSVK